MALELGGVYELMKLSVSCSGWLSNIIQVVLDKSGDVTVFRINTNWSQNTKKSAIDLRDAVKRSERILGRIGKILDTSTSREVFSKDLESWLVELRDMLFSANDIMEEFKYWFETTLNLKDDLEHKVLDTMTNSVLNFIDTAELSLAQNKDLLETLMRSNFSSMSIKETSRFPLDHVVFGREDDKADLLQTVDTNSLTKGLSIIAILGMTGIGKTTLARCVINDYVINNSFQEKIWVSLHSEFDVRGVIRMIMESITGQTCNISSLNKLQEILRKSLKKTKFFMVLDGARSEDKDDWESLLSPLRDAYQGSVVIVTTQSPLVASMLATTPTLRLQRLSDEHCGSIFWKYASKAEQQMDQELSDIGTQIIGKCYGMPSVAKTLGDILSLKKDKREWQHVLESDISDLQDGKSEIFSALKLSYCDLPSHLKNCCSYCVVFPKHHNFEKRTLIQLWIAEDILKINGGVWMEDLGDRYFDELVERCFFHQIPSTSDDNDTTLYQMNQLMYDMVQLVVGGPFLAVIDEGTPRLNENVVRYLSMVDHEGSLEWLINFKNLKSFMLMTGGCSIEVLPEEFFTELTWIRVLDLSKSEIQVLPTSIKCLKLLRYLNLSETPIYELCDQMCYLSMLQTLDIRKCQSLSKLPEALGNLYNLRHLEMDEHNRYEIPPGIGNLIMLQELKNFTVSQEDGNKITELQNLAALHGELHIMRLDNVLSTDEAGKANLQYKEFLSVLELEWSIRPRESENERDLVLEMDILEHLRPHHNLQKLDIMYCRIDKTPNWVWDYPSRLEHVTLASCLNLKCIQTLKCLQFLKTLEIIGNDVVEEVDRSFFGLLGDSVDTDFCSLETLVLNHWYKVKSWIGVYGNDFKRLNKITIINCPVLEIVPDFNGSRSLREMVFHTCENLSFSQGRRPKSLQSLAYRGCTKLENPQNDERWPFVLLHGNEIN